MSLVDIDYRVDGFTVNLDRSNKLLLVMLKIQLGRELDLAKMNDLEKELFQCLVYANNNKLADARTELINCLLRSFKEPDVNTRLLWIQWYRRHHQEVGLSKCLSLHKIAWIKAHTAFIRATNKDLPYTVRKKDHADEGTSAALKAYYQKYPRVGPPAIKPELKAS